MFGGPDLAVGVGVGGAHHGAAVLEDLDVVDVGESAEGGGLVGPGVDYGGDLVIEDHYGTQEVKLPAGDLVLYPSTSLHLVTQITRGVRTASFFWLQSMIRDAQARSLIFDLDNSIQELVARLGRNDPEVRRLTNVYHNLIRYWAEL